MILVTVGTQGGFDRLVQTVDRWAQTEPGRTCFAQIGPGEYQPQHMEFARELDPVRFEDLLQQAQIVIAHAGMGTILKALEFGKPVLVMPRRASLGEQRNEHQLATAEKLGARGLVEVAMDETELAEKLQDFEGLAARERIAPTASPELIGALRSFFWKHLGPPPQAGDGERASGC